VRDADAIWDTLTSEQKDLLMRRAGWVTGQGQAGTA
jgi:hypothetical protein